jgi:hypothetical protein
MMRISLIIIFFFSFIFVSCTKNPGDDPIIVDSGPAMAKFSFLRQQNPGLVSDIMLNKDGNRFYGSVPVEAQIENMVATIELSTGSIATIEGNAQESGITKNDFTQILKYSILKSGGSTEEYTIDVKKFTGLPIIYIETQNEEVVLSKDDYVNAHVSVYGGRNFEDIDGDIVIRCRGNSTWYFHPKKPYQIKFNEKAKMLGMPKDRKWLLLAEYSDKTFLRNRLAYEMGYLSNLEWTPESQYAEVFMNGVHVGLYMVVQKVEETSNRVKIDEDGYLLEIDQLDRLDPNDVYFYGEKFLLNIKEPEIEYNSPEYTYIKGFIEDFEKALFGGNFKDPVNGYQKYIDVESVVDWYLINEIAKNVDAKDFASIFMYMNPGDKLKMGPIWDFDLGFGNVNYAAPEFPTGFWVQENAWIHRMLEDPSFALKVKMRFSYFKNKKEALFEMMDEQSLYIYHSQWINNSIWNVLGQWVWPNAQVFNSYEEEVLYLKDWIELRLDWLEPEINKL